MAGWQLHYRQDSGQMPLQAPYSAVNLNFEAKSQGERSSVLFQCNNKGEVLLFEGKMAQNMGREGE